MRARAVLPGALLALLCLAPTPGDVGGCGQPAELLDPPAFFEQKRVLECARCRECGHFTARCSAACTGEPPGPRAFPEGCFPLVHDGEVCLRALEHATCDDWAGYLRDTAPTAPSECNFCPPGGAP